MTQSRRTLVSLIALLVNCVALFGQLYLIWVPLFEQVPIPFFPFLGFTTLRAAWVAGRWNGWWK